jgi:hypothetical protein
MSCIGQMWYSSNKCRNGRVLWMWTKLAIRWHQMHLSFTLRELCTQNRPVSLAVRAVAVFGTLSRSMWTVTECAGDGYYLINRSLNGHLTDQPQTEDDAFIIYHHQQWDMGAPLVWRCWWSPWYGSITRHVQKPLTTMSKKRWWAQSVRYSLDYFCWF